MVVIAPAPPVTEAVAALPAHIGLVAVAGDSDADIDVATVDQRPEAETATRHLRDLGQAASSFRASLL